MRPKRLKPSDVLFIALFGFNIGMPAQRLLHGGYPTIWRVGLDAFIIAISLVAIIGYVRRAEEAY